MSSYRERLHAGYYEPGATDPATEEAAPAPKVASQGGSETSADAPPPEQQGEDEENGERLPGRHAGLDALAAERGYTWSADELTIRQKREELAALE